MSEKKQKLFLNPPDGSGFQELAFEASAQTDTFRMDRASDAKSHEYNDFELTEDFWSTIEANPELKQGFERFIENRVRKRVQESHHELTRKIREKAREIGFQEGMAQADQKLQHVAERAEQLLEQILNEKQKILQDHAKAWCQALKVLLDKFLIAQGPEIYGRLESWLTEAVGNLATGQSVRVCVSPKDFEQVRDGAFVFSRASWELIADPSLSEGEICCETEAGKLFFSPTEASEKLEAILQQYFPSNERSPILGSEPS